MKPHWLKDHLSAALDYLYPPIHNCPGCGAEDIPLRTTPSGLCSPCHTHFSWVEPQDLPKDVCAAAHFEGSARAMVSVLKYREGQYMAPLMARLMAQALEEQGILKRQAAPAATPAASLAAAPAATPAASLAAAPAASLAATPAASLAATSAATPAASLAAAAAAPANWVVIPVPLHPSREKQRGYNQAQLLACQLAHVLHFSYKPHALIRHKKTVPLHRLSRQQRAATLADSMTLNMGHNQQLRHQHILLVDDIYTTGATANACREALSQAAPAGITLAAFALADVITLRGGN